MARTAKADQLSSTPIAAMTAEYELMENYQLGGPLAVGTEISALRVAPGGGELITIGTDFTSVWHVYQDPLSATGWSWYQIPVDGLPNSGGINTLASVADNQGRRWVAVGFGNGSVYATVAAPGNAPCRWNSWSALQTNLPIPTPPLDPVILRLVLGANTNGITLGIVVNSALYGTQTRGQVVGGVLTLVSDAVTYTGFPPSSDGAWNFYIDNLAIGTTDFPGQGSPGYTGSSGPGIIGCVSPTLVIYPETNFVQAPGSTTPTAIWNNISSKYNPAAVAFYRPNPVDPSAYVLCDFAYPAQTRLPGGGYADTWPGGTQTIPCAGSIELDYETFLHEVADGALPLLWPADSLSFQWSDDGTWTYLNGSAYVAASSSNFAALFSPAGWIAVADNNQAGKNFPLPQPFQGITANFALVRSSLLSTSYHLGQQGNPDSTPLWSTNLTKDTHCNQYMAVYSILDTNWNLTGMTLGVWNQKGNSAPSKDPPTNANFVGPNYYITEQYTYQDPSWIISMSTDGQGWFDVYLSTRTNTYINFCSIDSIDPANPGVTCFAIDNTAQGNLWTLPPGSATQATAWVQLTGVSGVAGPVFTAASTRYGATMGAILNDGVCHLFLVDTKGDLYHMTNSKASPTDWSAPVAIAENIAAMRALPKDKLVEVFAVRTPSAAPASLVYLTLSESGWTQSTIDLSAQSAHITAKLTEVSSYTLNVMCNDANAMSVPFGSVSLSASENCFAIINGVSARLPANVPLPVVTSAAGEINIVIPTADITVPAFTLAPAGNPSGTIVVQPNSSLAAKLAACNKEQLLAAKVDGEPLLKDWQRRAASAVAAAIQEMGRIATAPEETTPAKPTEAGPSANVEAPLDHWSIAFPLDGDPVFTIHHGDEEAMDANSVFSRIHAHFKDVLKWLRDEAHKLVRVEFKNVKGVWRVAIDFIDSEGKLVLKYAILAAKDLMNQALAFVVPFFRRIGVEAARVVKWLSALFNWTNIGYAAQAVSYSINTILSALASATTSLEAKFDSLMSSVESGIASQFQNWQSLITNQYPNGQTISGVRPSVTPPGPRGVQAKLITGSLVHNAQFAALATPYNPSGTGIAAIDWTTFENTMKTAVGTWPADTFKPFCQSGGILNSADSILSAGLSDALGMLETVVTSALSLAQAGVDALLSGLASLIQDIQTWMQTPVNIPWVSNLYQLKFGSQLTFGALIALVLAVPMTVVCPLFTGKAPFGSAAEVAAFEAEFTEAAILTALGLNSGSASTDVALSGASADALNQAQAALQLAGSVVATYADATVDALVVVSNAVGTLGPIDSWVSIIPLAENAASFVSAVLNVVSDVNAEGVYSAYWSGIYLLVDTIMEAVSFTDFNPEIRGITRLSLGDLGIVLDVGLGTWAGYLAAVCDGEQSQWWEFALDLVSAFGSLSKVCLTEALCAAVEEIPIQAIPIILDVAIGRFGIFVGAMAVKSAWSASSTNLLDNNAGAAIAGA